MEYTNVRSAVFINRPNRFIADVEIEGRLAQVHVKNTGRCRELLIPGTEVFLNESDNQARKTRYDLIAVRKGKRLINVDSAAPNAAFGEVLRAGGYIKGCSLIKAEAVFRTSRFDFYVEAGLRKIFIEVKGVTLEEEGAALFPDAPTLRGIKHLNELNEAAQSGFEARIVFVIQMKGVRYFTANYRTHPAFGEALLNAYRSGVQVEAFDCEVTETSVAIGNPVDVRFLHATILNAGERSQKR